MTEPTSSNATPQPNTTPLQKVDQPDFLAGEHDTLRFWAERAIFDKLRKKLEGARRQWSFLDGPMTANNPMGVHHAMGRTYKDAFHRYRAMTGHRIRYQNGFDCQGLWVEVEVEKQLGLGSKDAIYDYGVDRFVNACKQRVLNFAARQTEQSVRLGYWMDWDDPDTLRLLGERIGTGEEVTITTPSGREVTDTADDIVARLGHPEWGGSYFTYSTENNETIWRFLKTCHERGKIYRGHDVMPWSGRGGSAYSQMEVADGRKLTTHRAAFVRFPILRERSEERAESREVAEATPLRLGGLGDVPNPDTRTDWVSPTHEYLLVWTTTPWTLTSNVAAAVNPDLEYVALKVQSKDAPREGEDWDGQDTYYFAADNLDYKRQETQFKEGFGSADQQWPADVPKLKTLRQIFKEKFGDVDDSEKVKGSELLGWRYRGPMDELVAQQTEGGVHAGSASIESPASNQPADAGRSPTLADARSPIDSHAVIDGGRDFKGNALVVAGEGTGIVHAAPGCGDVDHQWGQTYGLPEIAPLKTDGTFGDGFGEFSGREAIDPETATMVFDSLEKKGLLVHVEKYPHIYPHCWRTGDELVFRLVDEWFIDMDWRDEIKEVVETIDWKPKAIGGRERELEWLTIMRDWMISKKRFWGLALPIWRDEQTGHFEVFGSVAELKAHYDQHGGEGWEQFEGHTPHRPWIDAVKVTNPATGNLMSRVEDVGNPWLDAGITPFSTMGYGWDRAYWEQWFPADLVTECFPGQFRNWFYSLLALSTMMRHDQETPEQKAPFRTLFGYRLVMDEDGQPMHKSDGTAIWFEEAAEQLGVDAIRWRYLSADPARDLRFGRRHPDQPVALTTPDGEITETREGAPTCKVTSTPIDEVRRQVLIPLWNSYAFFVNYARLDGYDPAAANIPAAERPEIDRWLLSQLQGLIAAMRDALDSYDTQSATQAAAGFIEELSTWYIRRNRRRFWSKGQASEDADKQAAYDTLHETLTALCKLLAPLVPFLSERMYRNLVDTSAEPESVHLCDYPEVEASLRDDSLSRSMAAAQTVVRIGHRLREESGHRVRQPLAELRFAADGPDREAIEKLAGVVAEELNVKVVNAADDLDELVSYTFKPNLKTLGPKYGKRLGTLRKELPAYDAAALAPLRAGESVTIALSDGEVELGPDDVLVSVEQAGDWASGDEAGIQVALATELTDDLVREGLARDAIRLIQQARKDAGLEIEDRITVALTADTAMVAAVREHDATIGEETLADAIEASEGEPSVTVSQANS